nr:hypothetical protein [Streptomyces sabulosicollis]
MTMYNLATGKAVTTMTTQHTPTYGLPEPRDLSKNQAEMTGERV